MGTPWKTDAPPLAASAVPPPVAPVWQIARQPLALLWNVRDPWWNELQKPAAERMDYPFGIEPVHVKEFLERFRSQPPVYANASSDIAAASVIWLKNSQNRVLRNVLASGPSPVAGIWIV